MEKLPLYKNRKFWVVVLIIQILTILIYSVILEFEPIVIIGITGSALPSLLLADYIDFWLAALLGTSSVWLIVYLLVKLNLNRYFFYSVITLYYLFNLYVVYTLGLL